ncbi:MAG: type II toxin-antitoxin system VapC family toxin [Gemmatimonadetes bacterium]|nr:type II toxin-antitoxin system VapC family toxin [Gemmatimonadota bacterium]
MRLLLDTHIWLWSILEPARLARRVVRELERNDAELWLSPISVWEFVNLVERDRIRLQSSPDEWVSTALRRVPFREAPVTHEIALETRNVKLSHRDPADRFLVATARVFDLRLVTADERLIRLKSVPTLANR